MFQWCGLNHWARCDHDDLMRSLWFPDVCLPLLDQQRSYSLDKSTHTTCEHNIHPEHSPPSILRFILLLAADLFPNRRVTTSQEVAALPSLFLKATQHLLWVQSLKKTSQSDGSEVGCRWHLAGPSAAALASRWWSAELMDAPSRAPDKKPAAPRLRLRYSESLQLPNIQITLTRRRKQDVDPAPDRSSHSHGKPGVSSLSRPGKWNHNASFIIVSRDTDKSAAAMWAMHLMQLG